MIVWKNERRRIADLIPADYNPREMNEQEVKDLRQSLDDFGTADPIVINKDNTIIGGHQRVRILKERGDLEVDVRVPERLLTKDEEIEANVRLNKNVGRFNFDALANLDEELLKRAGFGDEELSKIFTEDPSGEVKLPYKIILNFRNQADWEAILKQLKTDARIGQKSKNVDGRSAVAVLGGAS